MKDGMVVESYVHKAEHGGSKEGKCGEAKCGADKGKKWHTAWLLKNNHTAINQDNLT